MAGPLAVPLGRLIEGSGLLAVTGDKERPISGLSHDSRSVRPGELFFALQGFRTDGNIHAREAVSRGAAAVLSELPGPPPPVAMPAAWVQVSDAALAMGRAADRFFGHPSRDLEIVGVTGTNGKTTTCYFLESIARTAGKKAGVIGSVNYRLGGEIVEPAPNTTPISLELIRTLARFRDAGARSVMMEVSSHALALKRVEEIEFDAAIFTNLGRDHLDFHKTPEEYLRAKCRLFELLGRLSSGKENRWAVINAEDPARKEIERAALGSRHVLYGFKDSRPVRASAIRTGISGSSFDLHWQGRKFPARIRLAGGFNVLNALAAAAAALALGYPEKAVLEGLDSLQTVPGRLEAVSRGQDFSVFVDYAHTEEALRAALSALKALPHRRLIAVFGCGGDRDAGKRAPMGRASCELGDVAIFTSDNPRSEDPLAILREVEAGPRAAGLSNFETVPDRREAIRRALGLAREGDLVLIAGKGHEDYQVLGKSTIHFDDRETAAEALEEILGAGRKRKERKETESDDGNH